MNRQLVKGTVIFTGVSITTIALNFLFYFIGRFLSVEDFGLLVALIAFSYLITVCQNVILNLFTKLVAHKNAVINVEVLEQRVWKFELGLIAIVFLAALLLKDLLKITDYGTVLVLLSLPFTSLRLAFLRAVLRGKKLFNQLAVTLIIESLFKLILGFTALALGLGINGIVLGIGMAGVIAYLLAKVFVNKIKLQKDQPEAVRLSQLFSIKEVIQIASAFLIVNMIFVADSLIARQTLSAYEAGIFAAVVTFGKVIFFLSSSVSNALLPLSSEKGAKFSLLLQAIFLSLLIGFATLVGFGFAGEFVVRLLLGENFAMASSYLIGEALFITIYTAISQFAIYMIGKGRYGFAPILLVTLIIQVLLLFSIASSIALIWQVQSIIMLFTLVAMFSFYFLSSKGDQG